ncbi:MAG: NAD(P)H:quinone oxidoreductase [Desulfobacteraceae bacterium]|nr:NAD(P)H:quinone oxidoreductase [Desulfobacteraceae bacterium]
MQLLIVYYSLYGHVAAMAEAAAEGARQVEGVAVAIRRVPETLPPEVIVKMGASEAQKTQSQVPVCTVEELAGADAILFGTPTRFGNMCGQMRQFLDSTGQLWVQGALIGKPGGVFVSTATQHGGQESTILSFQISLLHHGMVVVGLPYSFQGQMGVEEVKGGSPYGATTIAGHQGERRPSAVELEAARFQGRHLADIGKRLKG